MRATRTEDVRVTTIQGILKGLNHITNKGLGVRHLKVLLGVEQFICITSKTAYPDAEQIASMIGVHPDDFEDVLAELVELRYLHKMHSAYGELVYTYKMGAMGGTMLRQVLPAGGVVLTGS